MLGIPCDRVSWKGEITRLRTIKRGREGTAEQREHTGFSPRGRLFLNSKFLLTEKDGAFSYSIKG